MWPRPTHTLSDIGLCCYLGIPSSHKEVCLTQHHHSLQPGHYCIQLVNGQKKTVTRLGKLVALSSAHVSIVRGAAKQGIYYTPAEIAVLASLLLAADSKRITSMSTKQPVDLHT